jgi:cytochrome c biogenesis protein CcmG/thiol:disulfide interchange protein DsbE
VEVAEVVPTDELEGYTRRSRARRIVVAAALLVAAAGATYFATRPAAQPSPPRFELPLLTGGRLSSDELEGSPVVLNFFASWCAPCREEAPLLEAAWRAHRSDGVRFVGVDVQDTDEAARHFVREFDVTYPILRWDESRVLTQELGVYGLPQTFFITHEWELLDVAAGDRMGSESRSFVPLGAISEEQLEKGIETLVRHLEEDL